MKKHLFLLLTTLLTAVGAFAQDWKLVEPEGNEYSSTWVIAQLNTNLTAAQSKIAIGAFIGEECRAIALPETNAEGTTAQSGSLRYSIRIPSYKRFGEPGATITFKAWDQSTGLEYVLKETVEYANDVTYGTPTKPQVLNLTAPTKYTITLVEAAVGQTYKLADYLVVDPKDAILPSNLQWQVGKANSETEFVPADSAFVADGQLVIDGFSESIVLQLGSAQGTVLTSKTLDVVLHATSITLNQQKLEVEKTDYGTRKLNEFAWGATTARPYTVGPKGTTDAGNVRWELQKQDDPVLALDGEAFTILKKGTAHIRPYVVVVDKNTNKETTIYPADDAWVTVEVTVPVTSIEVDEKLYGTPVRVNMTDQNIYERLADIVAVMPEDASNRNFTFQCTDGSMKVEGNKIIPQRAGQGVIFVISEGKTAETGAATGEGADATAVAQQLTRRITVLIENPAMGVEFADGTNALTVISKDNEVVDLNAKLKAFIKYQGETKQNVSIDIKPIEGTSVTGEGHLNADNGEVAYALKVAGEGTTKMQIVLTWRDYASWKGNPNEIPTKTATITFDILVQHQLTLNRFLATVTEAANRKAVTITLTPYPEGATFDADKVVLDFQLKVPDMYAQNAQVAAIYQKWSPTVVTNKKVSADKKAIVWEFTSTMPGDVAIAARLGDEAGTEQSTTGNTVATIVPIYQGQNQLTSINVGYSLDLAEGWQWRGNPWGNVTPDALVDVFGGEKKDGKMVEIRTQSDLLYNDDNYGFYGSLMDTKGLSAYEGYKVKMREDYNTIIYSNVSETLRNLPKNMKMDASGNLTITLTPGWNWVGFPFFYNRSLSKLSDMLTDIPEGLFIKEKEEFAEYAPNATENQKWTGNLEYLKQGQGYLVHNPKSEAVTFKCPFELANFTPVDEDAQVVANAPSRVWGFDHSRFMNNMALVAQLDNIADSEDCVVGAFVDGECRGEANVQNGRAYVTVHCEGGERVSFKLYNRLTGETEEISEQVSAQSRLGSSRAPLHLHSVATDIQQVGEGANATRTFDLSGRAVVGQQRGIVIERTSNGTYRKVVNK